MGASHAPLTPAQRLARNAQVLKYLRDGYTLREIAKILSIRLAAVHKAKIEIESLGARALQKDAELYASDQLQTLLHIRRDALAAWDASKKPKIKTKKRRQPVVEGHGDTQPQGIVVTEENTFEVRDGSAAYLMVAMRAMEHEARLLRLLPDDVGTGLGRAGYDPETEAAERSRLETLWAQAMTRARDQAIDIDVTPSSPAGPLLLPGADVGGSVPVADAHD